jgi:DNA-binding transcriptional regulator YdaS (Cro superfamily)
MSRSKNTRERYTRKSGLVYAIEKAGGQAQLGKLLGVDQPTISNWLSKDNLTRIAPNPDSGIARAIEAAGSQKALAEQLGVVQQQISLWLAQGFVPVPRAAEIEHITGVPRATLISPKLLNAIDSGSAL